MEFQAIVLAGGHGTRLDTLTTKCAKCLLPVGNKPMIWYPIRMLEKAGFSDIFIVTFESIKSKVESELKAHGIKSNLHIVGIKENSDDEEYGTAYSLKLLKDKISKDCIIVSCDLITNLCLQKMANFYRVNNASFVMLLSDSGLQSPELFIPGSREKYTPERDLIALDTETNRVLYFTVQEDIDELKIRTSVLKKFPKFVWTNRLQDSHLYFIKKWLIDYIIDNNKIFYLKSDFVPFICKKQFSRCLKQKQEVENEKNQVNKKLSIFDYVEQKDFGFLMNKSSLRHPISCYAFIQADGFCLRTNNLPMYTEANRQIMGKIMPNFQRERTESSSKQERCQVSSDSIVGEGTTIGEKTSIKRSVIGKNCKISRNCKINNSILMDNVQVAEGVILQGTIICANSKINQKSEFKDCVVSYDQDIITAGKYSNETIKDVESFIEDSDSD